MQSATTQMLSRLPYLSYAH